MLQTHAPAAALHARRSTPKGVSRRRSACGSSAHGLQNGESAQMEAGPGRLDRLDAGQDGLRPRPQLSTARCPCFGPRRASAAGAQQPRRAHVLSLWLSGEAHAPHAGLPSLRQTPATRPERAQDEKAQAGGRRRSLRRRRHTAGPHCHHRSRPRPTRSLTAQPYPTATSTHVAAVRLLARLTHAYRPWAGNKRPRLGTRVPATPGLVRSL